MLGLQNPNRGIRRQLSPLLPNWRDVLVIVKPETVIGWHRKGFRLYWTWRSWRCRGGRPPIPQDVRALIRRMSRENPLWGAPRIHGELLARTDPDFKDSYDAAAKAAQDVAPWLAEQFNRVLAHEQAEFRDMKD